MAPTVRSTGMIRGKNDSKTYLHKIMELGISAQRNWRFVGVCVHGNAGGESPEGRR